MIKFRLSGLLSVAVFLNSCGIFGNIDLTKSNKNLEDVIYTNLDKSITIIPIEDNLIIRNKQGDSFFIAKGINEGSISGVLFKSSDSKTRILINMSQSGLPSNMSVNEEKIILFDNYDFTNNIIELSLIQNKEYIFKSVKFKFDEYYFKILKNHSNKLKNFSIKAGFNWIKEVFEVGNVLVSIGTCGLSALGTVAATGAATLTTVGIGSVPVGVAGAAITTGLCTNALVETVAYTNQDNNNIQAIKATKDGVICGSSPLFPVTGFTACTSSFETAYEVRKRNRELMYQENQIKQNILFEKQLEITKQNINIMESEFNFENNKSKANENLLKNIEKLRKDLESDKIELENIKRTLVNTEVVNQPKIINYGSKTINSPEQKLDLSVSIKEIPKIDSKPIKSTNIINNKANSSPIINSFLAIPTYNKVKATNELKKIDLYVGATDSDNDTLSYTWYSNNKYIRNELASDIYLGIGKHTIKVEVSDGKSVVSRSSDIYVELELKNNTPTTSNNTNSNLINQPTPNDLTPIINIPNSTEIPKEVKPTFSTNNEVLFKQGSKPTVFPDGNKIVYFDNFDMYISNISGTNTKVLKSDVRWSKASISPDGKVAFIDEKNNLRGIYTINQDGSDLKRIVADNSLDLTSLSWSPDGKKIAFSKVKNAQSDIFTVDADGNNEQNITNDVHIDIAPSYSPSGEYIAYISQRKIENPTTTKTYNNDIYIMNADGSNKFNLTGTDKKIDIIDRPSEPSWSNDSNLILFSSTTKDSNTSNIYITNFHTLYLTKLTNIGNESNPFMIPFDKKIGYVRVGKIYFSNFSN